MIPEEEIKKIKELLPVFKMQNLDHKKQIVNFYNEYISTGRKEPIGCLRCVIRVRKELTKLYGKTNL